SQIQADLATPQKAPTVAELSELAKQIQAEREKLEQIQKAIAAAKKAGCRKKKENAQQSAEPAVAAQPTTRLNGDRLQLTREAFVFSEEDNCFFCPLGKKLEPRQKFTDKRKSGLVVTGTRYQSNAVDCADCPLKALCHGGSGRAKTRLIRREDEDKQRREHAKKMATPQSQEQYKKRRESVERVFAVIRHCFGVRQFRNRGIKNVRTEWLWILLAFNLQLMTRSVEHRGPPDQPGSTSPHPP
ncbi:MAG: transposase, partial [Planctomycetota bacterium]